jgi:hypothetical protein
MPRPYSEEFMRFINTTGSSSLGIRLGRACVRANLPLVYVARALGISKVTLFNWFRGRGMRESMRDRVEVFLEVVERDLEANILPTGSYEEAGRYIKEVTKDSAAAL